MNDSTPSNPTHASDEPELSNEEAVPNDGRDVEGEEMMKEVRNKKLQEPGDREHKTPDKAA